jgi:hypothetical protein
VFSSLQKGIKGVRPDRSPTIGFGAQWTGMFAVSELSQQWSASQACVPIKYEGKSNLVGHVRFQLVPVPYNWGDALATPPPKKRSCF